MFLSFPINPYFSMPLPSWLVFAVAFLPLSYYNEAKLKEKIERMMTLEKNTHGLDLSPGCNFTGPNKGLCR